MIVLDASVILKWFLDNEEGNDAAALVKEDHVGGSDTIAVPDLLYYEVANVLSSKTRLSAEAVEEAFSLLWDFQLERFDFALEHFLAALALVRKYKITVYDAAYIELARRLQCRFLTADKKLYEKTKSLRMIELL